MFRRPCQSKEPLEKIWIKLLSPDKNVHFKTGNMGGSGTPFLDHPLNSNLWPFHRAQRYKNTPDKEGIKTNWYSA